MSQSTSSQLKRRDTAALVGAGFAVPGLALAVLILGIALKWPEPAKIGTQFLLFTAIVWVVVFFPKIWGRHMTRREARQR